MSDLRELYQEVILDHGKSPRNFGRLAAPTCEAHGNNPLCGDQVTVYLTVADGVVQDAAFEGRGCAISMASTSMMTEILKGKTIAEVETMFRRFHQLVTGEDGDDAADLDEDSFEKLIVLSGVREFPMRVKCATLAWHTMSAALKNGGDGAAAGEVTTE